MSVDASDDGLLAWAQGEWDDVLGFGFGLGFGLGFGCTDEQVMAKESAFLWEIV